MKTITLMCKTYECLDSFDSPRTAIRSVDTWIFSSLSLDGGSSPLHYWSPSYAVMEDFWSQDDLDQYASFHGVTAVHSFRLKDGEADAFISKISRNSIDNSPPKSDVE